MKNLADSEAGVKDDRTMRIKTFVFMTRVLLYDALFSDIITVHTLLTHTFFFFFIRNGLI